MHKYAERMKAYFAVPENRIKRNEAGNRYYQRNKWKRQCYDAVCKALMNGTLIKPATCQLCLNRDLEAHHEDYTKPLEVTWLCLRHHGQLHRVKRFMAKQEIDVATLRLIV